MICEELSGRPVRVVVPAPARACPMVRMDRLAATIGARTGCRRSAWRPGAFAPPFLRFEDQLDELKAEPGGSQDIRCVSGQSLQLFAAEGGQGDMAQQGQGTWTRIEKRHKIDLENC